MSWVPNVVGADLGHKTPLVLNFFQLRMRAERDARSMDHIEHRDSDDDTTSTAVSDCPSCVHDVLAE